MDSKKYEPCQWVLDEWTNVIKTCSKLLVFYKRIITNTITIQIPIFNY